MKAINSEENVAATLNDIEIVDKRENSCAKFTKIVTITNSNNFETLKTALTSINITGMTVSNVLGFGMQKGSKSYYRGAQIESTLLPKVKVEIVICKIPVEYAVKTIKKALYSGNVGDGKIFIYNVENVIKIRTGEEGYDALQDDDKQQ